MDNGTATVAYTIPITKSSRRVFKLMEKDEITLVFTLDAAVYFHIGDWIEDEIFGKFYLMEEQTPVYNKNTGGYDYQLVLVAPYRKWDNHEFTLTNASSGTENVEREECSWSITDNLTANVREFIRCLDAIGETYNSLPYVMQIHATASHRDEVCLMTYDSLGMIKSLNAMAETWKCEWWVTYEVPSAGAGDILLESDETEVTGGSERGVIHFGKCDGDVPYLFSERPQVINNVTCKPTVETMSAQRNGNENANRLFVLGGTKNLPESYRKVLKITVAEQVENGAGTGVTSYRPDKKITTNMLAPAIGHEYTAASWSASIPVANNKGYDIITGSGYGTTFKLYGHTDEARLEASSVSWSNAIVKIHVVIPQDTSVGGPVNVECVGKVELFLMYGDTKERIAVQEKTVTWPGSASSNRGDRARSVAIDIADGVCHPPSDTFKLQIEGEFHVNKSGAEWYIPNSEIKETNYCRATFTAPSVVLDTYEILVGETTCYVIFNPDYCFYAPFLTNSEAEALFPVGTEISLVGLDYMEVPLNYYTEDTDDPSSLVGLGERRLRLPLSDTDNDVPSGYTLGNGYIEEDGVEEANRVELTVKKDDIYPRCFLRVTEVNTEPRTRKNALSDGSENVWTYNAYVLKVCLLDGSDFPFYTKYVKQGEKLKALFVSEIDEQEAYGDAGVQQPSTDGRLLLAGMEFEARWANYENTLTLLTNEDYGATLPNEVLKPSVNDTLVLTGWDVRAIESLGLVAEAEKRLLKFGVEYLAELKRGQFTFTCDMFSRWAESINDDNAKGLHIGGGAYVGTVIPNMLLPIEGSMAIVMNDSLPNSILESRILGYEFKLDYPWDTPRYTVGETEAYSRIKALEQSLSKGGSGGGSGAVSAGGGSYGGSGTLTLVTGTGTALSDLTDVRLQSPATGQTLVWNGGKWVNADVEGGGKTELFFVDYWLPSSGILADDKVIWDGTSLYRTRVDNVTENNQTVIVTNQDLIPLSTDAIYIDKRQNTPYRWDGEEMQPLSRPIYIPTPPDGTMVVNGVTLNLAHGHDWKDLVNRPNFVTGILIGKNKVAFSLFNGDVVVADFSSLASRVFSLENGLSQHDTSIRGNSTAIGHLQSDVQVLASRGKIVRLDGEVANATTEQVGYNGRNADEDTTHELFVDSVTGKLLLKVGVVEDVEDDVLIYSYKYYDVWEEAGDCHSRSYYNTNADLFVSTDANDCTLWYGSNGRLVPHGGGDEVAQLASDLAAETLARQNADTGLSNRIGDLEHWRSNTSGGAEQAISDLQSDVATIEGDIFNMAHLSDIGKVIVPAYWDTVPVNENASINDWWKDGNRLKWFDMEQWHTVTDPCVVSHNSHFYYYSGSGFTDITQQIADLQSADTTLQTAIAGKVADVKINGSSIVNSSKVANITVAWNVTKDVADPVSSGGVYNRIVSLRQDLLGKVLTPDYWDDTEPANPSDGEYWLNDDEFILYVYDGDNEEWLEIDGDADHPILLHNQYEGKQYILHKEDDLYPISYTAPVQGVKVNGSNALNLQRIANITVPTKTSDLTNDSSFTTTSQLSSEVSTRAAADTALGNRISAVESGKVSDVQVNGTSVKSGTTANIPVTSNGDGVVHVGGTDLNVTHQHDWADIKNTPNMLVGLGVGKGKITFYRKNGDVSEVTGLFNRVSATIDGGHGTPSVDATCVDGLLTLHFHNIQGEQGIQGDVLLYDPTNAATYTLYNTTGFNVDGAMTQRAVTEVLVPLLDVDCTENVTPVSGASYPWTYPYIGNIYVGDEISWEVTTESTMHWHVSTRIKVDGQYTNVDDTGKLSGSNSGSFVATGDAAYLGFSLWEGSVSDTTSFTVKLHVTRIKTLPKNSVKERSLDDGAVSTQKIMNGAVTALKADYSLANWQLFSMNVPDIDTVNGRISFGNVVGEDICIISQKGILYLNRKVNGEPAHPNLVIDGKIACSFRPGGVSGRLVAIFLNAATYSWVVRDLDKWDTTNETIKSNYPTDSLLLIGVVRLNWGSTYTSGDFKQGYFPFDFTVNGSLSAVPATQADYSLANWQLMSTSVPNVNTTTGYINFGDADGADIYIVSQKGILWLNHKVDGNYLHPNLIHEGRIECPFKLGTSDTRSSLSALFLDTKTYSWVVRDIYCWDRTNESVKNGYPTDGLIFIGAVKVNFSDEGVYVANKFDRGWFPFNFTVDGKSPTGDDGTGILDFNSTKELLPLFQNFRYDITYRTQISQHLVLLHFSDMHISSDSNTKMNLSRVLEFYNAYSDKIDDILHTGDTVRDNWDDTLTEWDAIDGTENILNVIGNHDVKPGTSVTPTLPQIYNKFISPYVSNWGVTQPTNAATNGRCYWYKDYTSAKIRLIGLDIMLEVEERFSSTERAAQRTWLETVLGDAMTNDYAVVIAQHYPSFLTPLEGSTFNTPPLFPIGNELAYLAPIVQDFIDDGGEFVCWLAGHTHRDCVGTLYNVENNITTNYTQLMFCVDTAKISSAVGWSDSVREYGKKSQDCMNLVSIDRYSKTVTFYRIGCNLNRLGMTKQMICWDYANCKMLYNR